MRKTVLFFMVMALLASIAGVRSQEQAHATQVVDGAVVPAQRVPPTTLDIYFIDTEGGKATLFVSPGGQTLLFDTQSRLSDDPRGKEREVFAKVPWVQQGT